MYTRPEVPRIASRLVCVLVLLFTGFLNAAAQNVDVVVNSSFSSGAAAPDHWKANNYDSKPPTFRFARDTRVFHSAPAALRIESVNGRAQGLLTGENWKFVPGKTCRVRFYVKGTGKWDFVAFACQPFRFLPGYKFDQLAWIQFPVKPGEEWTEIAEDVTLPPGTEHVAFHFIAVGEGKLWIDDIKTQTRTIQIENSLPGTFLYRFLTDKDNSWKLEPLPGAESGNLYTLPVPPTLKGSGVKLEILNRDNGTTALLKLPFEKPYALTAQDFKYLRVVSVPVRASGKPVTGVTVALHGSSKTFHKEHTLAAQDNGTAHFYNVPLNEAVTLHLSYGSKSPLTETRTLTTGDSAEGYTWPTVNVKWPGLKTVSDTEVAAAVSKFGSDAPQAVPVVVDSPLQKYLIAAVILLGALSCVLAGMVFGGRLRSASTATALPAGQSEMARLESRADSLPASSLTLPVTTTVGAAVGTQDFSRPYPVPAVSASRLVALSGAYAGYVFPLGQAGQERILIGRDASNTVPLPRDTAASRIHATIQAQDGDYLIMDEGSTNGTFVNGVRLRPGVAHLLTADDELEIGATKFRFEMPAALPA